MAFCNFRTSSNLPIRRPEECQTSHKQGTLFPSRHFLTRGICGVLKKGATGNTRSPLELKMADYNSPV